MAMELFSTIYACCDLQDKSMQTLAMSVWSIISESNQANKKNLVSTPFKSVFWKKKLPSKITFLYISPFCFSLQENILKSMKSRGGVYKEVANQLKLPETWADCRFSFIRVLIWLLKYKYFSFNIYSVWKSIIHYILFPIMWDWFPIKLHIYIPVILR